MKASELPQEQPEQRWLIHGLWAAEGVGVIGGSPKCLKSWCGLEMAVSIASRTPCFGRFETPKRGRALIYMAEDAIPDVRERLESLSRHHKVSLASLDIFVITANVLRIDQSADQQRLWATVETIRPDLLLLDPLVRLHRQDENSSADMSALLGFLRQLQRQLHTAVVLVHHARKNGAVGQPGHALRGSSDLHAFGDSNLYLRRSRQRLVLTIEHRAAPSPEPLDLALIEQPAPHLEVVESAETSTSMASLTDAVLSLLRNSGPLTRDSMRRQLKVKNQRLGQTLEMLATSGTIERVAEGWRSAPKPVLATVPSLSPGLTKGTER
jgi:hypothetical protein